VTEQMGDWAGQQVWQAIRFRAIEGQDWSASAAGHPLQRKPVATLFFALARF